MKKLLLISLLLTMTTMMFGQTVWFRSVPEKPCEGDSVVFYAGIRLPGDRIYQLYRGFQRLESISMPADSVEFAPLVAEPGNYYVRVTWEGKEDATSDPIYVYASTSEFSETICSGGVYFWISQVWYDTIGVYNSPGDYVQTFTGVNNCDSVVTLHLEVLPPVTSEFDAATCEGTPYLWNGHEYTHPGDYEQTFTGVNDCDSVVTLHLSILPTVTSSETATICEGDTYTWNGVDYTEAGTYEKTFSTLNGCDSIVTLVLNVETLGDVEIQGETQVCHNKSAKYSVLVGSQTTCTWEVEGGVILSGENTSSVTVLWNDAAKGKVNLTVKKDNSDCTATDALDVTVNSYVGNLNGIHVKKMSDGTPYMLIYKNPEEGFKSQWYLNDEAIKDANGQYYMKEQGLDAGTYKVYVSFNEDTDGLFCGKYSESVDIAVTEKVLAVYPNPADEGEGLVVRGLSSEALVSVYSVDGRRLFQERVQGDGILPVQLKQGCYFVEILDADQNQHIEKLIIK